MKKIMKVIILSIGILLFNSCTVTESIIFNEDMSGEYFIGYDMANVIKSTKGMNDEEMNDEKQQKNQIVDTLIIFDEFLEEHKDSISVLSEEDQQKIMNLKGMTMRLQQDDEKELFNFSIGKKFNSITELETINEQVNEAMNTVKDFDNTGMSSASNDIGEITNENKAIYAFKDNTFFRIQPVEEKGDGDQEKEEGDQVQSMNSGLEEMTEDSFYIISYSFPKRIKSISNKAAQISKDGKSFTLSIPWNAIDKDGSLLNLEIVLED